MHDNIKEYYASWKWVCEQLERKEKNIADYKLNPKANAEYIRREEAFLASMKKFFKEANTQIELARNNRQDRMSAFMYTLLDKMYELGYAEETILEVAKGNVSFWQPPKKNTEMVELTMKFIDRIIELDQMNDTLIALLKAYGVEEITERDIRYATTMYQQELKLGLVKVPHKLQKIVFAE